MRIAVLGGKLQGLEAAYLARKAGWEVVVIDRRPNVPASGVCDEFRQADIQTPQDLNRLLTDADLMIPAMENDDTLACLKRFARVADIPVLFDFDAYALSSSKTASNRLFDQLRIPMPLAWPACGFPVVVKPDHGSGSHDVRVFHTSDTFRAQVDRPSGSRVVQEFVHGPLFSIEVLGRSGTFAAFQATDLEMDESCDCMRVTAPSVLSSEHSAEFESIAVKLARALSLRGLMDVEAVLHDNRLKVLEIDARFPSQTPSAVWWSSHINMLRLLAESFCSGGSVEKPVAASTAGVVYEHIQVSQGRLATGGEHLMSQAGALYSQTDFFGADEALTNYHAHRSTWAATLIHAGTTREDAWEKRNRVIAGLCRRFGLKQAHG